MMKEQLELLLSGDESSVREGLEWFQEQCGEDSVYLGLLENLVRLWRKHHQLVCQTKPFHVLCVIVYCVDHAHTFWSSCSRCCMISR